MNFIISHIIFVLENLDNLAEEKKTEEYVKRFMDTHQNSNDDSSTPIPNDTNSNDSQSMSWSIFSWSKNNRTLRNSGSEPGKNLFEEFIFTVPKDPYLSPYRASDEFIKKLPPIKILVCYY